MIAAAMATEATSAAGMRMREAGRDLAAKRASLVLTGRVGANFVIRSTEPDRLDRCAADLAADLAGVGFETVPGGI